MLFWVWVTEKTGESELYGPIKRMRKMKISAEKAFAWFQPCTYRMFLRGKVCGLTLSVAQSPPHLNKICGHIDQHKFRNVTIQIFFGTVTKEEKCNYWFLLDCIITCLFELSLTSEKWCYSLEFTVFFYIILLIS